MGYGSRPTLFRNKKKREQYTAYVVPGGTPDEFSPIDISGIVGWYEARLLTGLNDNDPVDEFTDQSGNLNHLLASTTRRPLFKTNILNGKSVLRYDGVNDFSIAPFTFNQPCSIFLVYKSITIGGSGANDIILDGGIADAQTVIDNRPATQLNAGLVLADLVTPVPANGVFVIAEIQLNGATSKLKINNVDFLSGNAGANNPGGLCVAAIRTSGRNTNIDVAAIYLYDSILSAGDLTDLYNYINEQYNVF